MILLNAALFAAFSFVLSCILLAHRLISRRIREPHSFRSIVTLACTVGMTLSGVSVMFAALPWVAMRPWLAALCQIVCVVLLALIAAVTAERWIVRSAVGEPRRILAIGAHPDDLELACGGTLAKFADSGNIVHALVLSHGGEGGDALHRVKEAASGATYMGAHSVAVHNFPDTALEDCANSLVRTIEEAIARVQPDMILTHSGNDQHQDHLAVHRATLRAARQQATILCYESPSATRDFNPSFFVDIGDYVGVKVAAVQAHADQAGKPYMSAERVAGMASFRGGQAKRRHAEAFELIRMSDASVMA